MEGRYGHKFRKCAGPVDAHTRCIAAQVAPACPAVAAITAGDVPFARNTVADLEAADLLAYFHDLAPVFVTDMHRHRYGLAGPIVPPDRKSVVEGMSVSIRVDPGGTRIIK